MIEVKRSDAGGLECLDSSSISAASKIGGGTATAGKRTADSVTRIIEFPRHPPTSS